MATQITLPHDAEGREIPLDTEIVYSREGNKLCISRIEFSPLCKEWTLLVVGIDGKIFRTWVLYPWQAYIEKPAQPDSWEKLLDDLDNTAEKASSSVYIAPCCAWFSGGDRRCDDCPANESPGVSCNVQLVNDISARIRKLRGENE